MTVFRRTFHLLTFHQESHLSASSGLSPPQTSSCSLTPAANVTPSQLDLTALEETTVQARERRTEIVGFDWSELGFLFVVSFGHEVLLLQRFTVGSRGSLCFQICVNGKPPVFFFPLLLSRHTGHYCTYDTANTLHKARLCSATLLPLCAFCRAGKENTARWSREFGQNLMTFARPPQITATSSKETTTSSWRTAA